MIITTVNHSYSSKYNDNVLYFDCDFPDDQHLEEVIRQSKNQINGLRAQTGLFSPQKIRQLECGMKNPEKWFCTRKQHPYAIVKPQEDVGGVSVMLGSWKRQCHTDFEFTFVPKKMLGTQVWVLQILASSCRQQERHNEHLPLPDVSPDLLPLSRSPPSDFHQPDHYHSADSTFPLEAFASVLEEVRGLHDIF